MLLDVEGFDVFPNRGAEELDAALPLNEKIGFAGGGPAGVVEAAPLPNTEVVGGVPAGVVLMASPKAVPFAGVVGAGLAVPNSGPLGVPAGVVLAPNTVVLAGVFGMANADFGFGVAGTSLEAMVAPPNGELPKTEVPLAAGAPNAKVLGASEVAFEVAAGALVAPEANAEAGLGTSAAAGVGIVFAAGAAFDVDVTPKLNLTWAPVPDESDVDAGVAEGAVADAGAPGLANIIGCDVEVVDALAAVDEGVGLLKPPIRARREGPDDGACCAGFSSDFFEAAGAPRPNGFVAGLLGAPGAARVVEVDDGCGADPNMFEVDVDWGAAVGAGWLAGAPNGLGVDEVEEGAGFAKKLGTAAAGGCVDVELAEG